LVYDVSAASRSRVNRGEQVGNGASSATALLTDGEWDSIGALMHLSHEVRTPLNSMLVLSQLLRDGSVGPLNAEQQKYVEVIERNGQNLIRLVNDVLDLSRLKWGRLNVDLQAIDLAEQLQAIVMTLTPLAQVKGLELVVEPHHQLPHVRCDPHRVRQVLTNLIGNALKFTERGRVSLSAEVRRGEVAVHVSDTGIGISEEARLTLFDRFFQRGGGAVTGDGAQLGNVGSGLGLAIAHRLVRLMGGDLSVESRVGVGSRFTFTLSVSEGELVGDRRVSAEVDGVRESSPSPNSASFEHSRP